MASLSSVVGAECGGDEQLGLEELREEGGGPQQHAPQDQNQVLDNAYFIILCRKLVHVDFSREL